MIGPFQAIFLTFRRTFIYSGRATRSEVIWFALFCVVGYIALEILQSNLWGWSLKDGAEERLLTSAFPFVVGLSAIALAVRRMQDIGFNSFLLAFPAILLYANLHLAIRLARDYEHFFNADYSGHGRPDNFLSQISDLLSYGQQYSFWAIVILFVLAPKNFAHKIPPFAPSTPEDKS